MKRISTLIITTGLLISSAAWAYIGPPRLIPVQGILTDASGNPLSGVQSIKFSLYNAETSGTLLWSEVQSIPVVEGFFTAYMGEGTTIDLVMFKDNFDLWLGVKVNDGEELPRVYLGITPYTAFAQYCGTVPAHTHPFGDITGTIGGDQISNASLTNAKIADSAVFASIRNAAGVEQFNVTNASNTIKFFGAGLASVTFDSGKRLVTVNAEITSPVPISLGGTGSSVQNFVDLTTNQTIAGIKTFSAAPSWGTGVATGNIDGNAAGFTSDLGGEITGAQASTYVDHIGLKTHDEIVQSVTDTQAATYETTGSTIVKHGVKGELKAYMFLYDAPMTKYVDVPSMAFLPPSPATTWSSGSIYGIHRYITGGGNYLVAPVVGLPTDVATTVTGFSCEIFDNHATYNVTLELLAHAGGFSPTSIGSVTSSGAQASVRTLYKSGLSVSSPARLFFTFQANTSCGSDCSIGFCRVSYTATGP